MQELELVREGQNHYKETVADKFCWRELSIEDPLGTAHSYSSHMRPWELSMAHSNIKMLREIPIPPRTSDSIFGTLGMDGKEWHWYNAVTGVKQISLVTKGQSGFAGV
jgi:hypothetical protein